MDSIDLSIEAAFREQQEALGARTRAAFVAAFEGGTAASDVAFEIENAVPRDIHLGRDSCEKFEPHTYFGCLMNSMKRKAERAYRAQREAIGVRSARGCGM